MRPHGYQFHHILVPTLGFEPRYPKTLVSKTSAYAVPPDGQSPPSVTPEGTEIQRTQSPPVDFM